MPSPIFCTGFQARHRHLQIDAGARTIVADGPAGSGKYAADFNTTAATGYLETGIPSAASGFSVWGFALDTISGGTNTTNILYTTPGSTFPALD